LFFSDPLYHVRSLLFISWCYLCIVPQQFAGVFAQGAATCRQGMGMCIEKSAGQGKKQRNNTRTAITIIRVMKEAPRLIQCKQQRIKAKQT
jgi:hypothetical protein